MSQPSQGTDRRKQSLYFSEDMLAEILEEAGRLDRSLSWCVAYAWKHGGRDALRQIPSVPEEPIR